MVLETGPFKFEASCVTYEHMYNYYTSSYSSTTSSSSRYGLRVFHVAVRQLTMRYFEVGAAIQETCT